MSRSESRMEGIDLLRALAIVMVIVHHLARSILKGFVPPLLAQGWTGVDLFFVISGYLVTRSFARWLANTGDSTVLHGRARLAVRYCARRFIRILPMAWLWALIPFTAALFLNRSGAFGPPGEVFRELLAVISFRYNYFTFRTELGHINHFWSLAVEEHFYLVLPFLLVLISRKSARSTALLLIALACMVARIFARRAGFSFGGLLFLTHFRADSLAIGSVLGLFAESLSTFGVAVLSESTSRARVLIAAVLAAALLWIGPAVLTKSQIAYFGFSVFAILSALLVSVGSVPGLLVRSSSAVSRLVAGIGRRSYSLYLIHVPLLQLFSEARWRIIGMPKGEAWLSPSLAGLELAIFLGALALVTELNYRVVEFPLIRLAGSRCSDAQASIDTKAIMQAKL